MGERRLSRVRRDVGRRDPLPLEGLRRRATVSASVLSLALASSRAPGGVRRSRVGSAPQVWWDCSGELCAV